MSKFFGREFSINRSARVGLGGLSSNTLIAGNVEFLKATNEGLQKQGGTTPLENTATAAKTIIDHEGLVKTTLPGEIRQKLGRRVENLATTSSSPTTHSITVISGNDYQVTIGRDSASAATAVCSNAFTGTLTGDATDRLAINVSGAPQTASTTTLTITITGSIKELLVEDVTGQANQNPSEYVDSDTDHGWGVNGVKYFNRLNGNTVTANIVTEAQGALITSVPFILHEPGATNLLTRSEEFDHADWIKQRSAVDADQTASANGAITADLVKSNGSAGSSGVFKTLTKAASPLQYTISCHIEKKEVTWASLFIADIDETNSARGYFNLTTGVVGSTATKGVGFTVDDIGIISVKNGFRCFLTSTTDSTTAVTGMIRHAVADLDHVMPGVLNDGFFAWGAQLQEGPLTEYIPTTTAAVSVDADLIRLPIANNHFQDKGVVLFRWKPQAASDTSNNGLLSTADAIDGLLSDSATAGTLETKDGTNTATINATSWAVDDDLIAAVIYGGSSMQVGVSKNGAAFVFGTAATYDGVFTLGSFLNWFHTNGFVNHLFGTKIYRNLPGGAIAPAKTWVENNAVTLMSLFINFADESGNFIADESGNFIGIE